MKSIDRNTSIIWGLSALLVISIGANAYLAKGNARSDVQIASAQATSSAVITGPGFKSETVTLFDGKEYRTYSTTTPLSESDVRRMERQAQAEFDRMNEFFRKQDETFRSLWNF